MPRILITGLPGSQDADALRELLTVGLPMAVQNVDGFGISRQHVYAYTLPDVVSRPSVVVAFAVEGLIAKPERTAQMRQALCNSLADAIAKYLEEIGARYESIIGWCVQIDRDDDGFVRRAPPESGW